LEIDGWQTMGQFGDTSELITTQIINRGRDQKQKGTNNSGSMENQFVILADDAGQIALRAAQKTKNNYAFRVDFPDGQKRYFIALVMGAPEVGGGANTINMLQSTLELNSNIVEVAAP
jgi:hypothetical protein